MAPRKKSKRFSKGGSAAKKAGAKGGKKSRRGKAK